MRQGGTPLGATAFSQGELQLEVRVIESLAVRGSRILLFKLLVPEPGLGSGGFSDGAKTFPLD